MGLEQDVTDPRLVKALTHPLRVRILVALDDRVASPRELSRELDAPLGNVSYHVRALHRLGLVRLVSETPKRGSVEHHYTAEARPVTAGSDWAAMPGPIRRTLLSQALQDAGREVAAATEAGGFERADARVARSAMALDAEGREALDAALREFLERVGEIERAAAARERNGAGAAESVTLLTLRFGAGESDPARPG